MEHNESEGLFVEEGEPAPPQRPPRPEPVVRPVSSADDRGYPPAAPPAEQTGERADASAEGTPTSEILGALERLEHLLVGVRSVLDAQVRESRHREFSPARLLGSLLQALVIGLLLWAVSDWAFGEPSEVLLIKLAFAAAFQLVALTAFVLGREVG